MSSIFTNHKNHVFMRGPVSGYRATTGNGQLMVFKCPSTDKAKGLAAELNECLFNVNAAPRQTASPSKGQIIEAIDVLRAALLAKFGDDAANAGMGDGCDIDVRCAGIDLLGADGEYLVNDGEPKEVAEALLAKD